MTLLTHRGQKKEYKDAETLEEYFSVSQIRHMAFDSFYGIKQEILDAAARRGTLVHTFMWRYLSSRLGLCEEPVLTPGVEGWCLSGRNWVDEHQVKPELLEHKSCNRKEGYAGQVDGQILYGPKEILTLADWKSGMVTVTDPMQLILYNEMEGLKSKQLLDVYLQADGGKAKEVFVDLKTKLHDWPWAMCALGNLKGRINHGVWR
ncbi:MAG: hypothetical protein ABIU97_01155 [Dehalococcoidia bacterium]